MFHIIEPRFVTGITYLDLALTGDDESYLSRDNGTGEIQLELIYRSSLALPRSKNIPSSENEQAI